MGGKDRGEFAPVTVLSFKSSRCLVVARGLTLFRRLLKRRATGVVLLRHALI